MVAGATRLELATSGVTGRRSNQLNYAPAIHNFRRDLIPFLKGFFKLFLKVVGGTGIEPATFGL